MPDKPRDSLGQLIEVGSIIAYGVRSGNTGDIRKFEVREIERTGEDRYSGRPEFKLWVSWIGFDYEKDVIKTGKAGSVTKTGQAIVTKLTRVDLVKAALELKSLEAVWREERDKTK